MLCADPVPTAALPPFPPPSLPLPSPLQAYLASETEGSDDDERDAGAGGAEEGSGDEAAAARERYRRLLLGGDAAAEERKGKKDWGAGGGEVGRVAELFLLTGWGLGRGW